MGIVLLLSFAALVAMYASNSDWGGDPTTPRGDGTYRPVLARGDGHMMFLMTRSLVLDHDLVYDNDLKRFGDPWQQPRTATGRKMIPHPIGPSLVQAPVFALAHGASKVLNLAGADIPSHGYTMFHQRIVFFLSVLAGFGAILIGFRISQKQLGGRWASLYAAVAVLFGTSLTYYATYMPSYAHALDAFFCSAFLGYWVLTVGEWRWKRFALLGVLLGLAALIRVTGFGLGVVVLVEVLARIIRKPESALTVKQRVTHGLKSVGLGALTLSIASLVFIPQLITWKLVFGEWVTSPMGPQFMRLRAPEWVETLFSSRNGWLSTHPIAYAGVVGLFFVPRRLRLVAAALLAAVMVQVYVNSCVFDWWSGASFGQRRLCSVTFVVVFGLAALVRAAGIAARRLPSWGRHAIAILVVGWFVTWNMAQVGNLREGKAANARLRSMCCDQIPTRLARIAKPIYERIGNPFAFPANLVLALRYGIPLKQFDAVVGDYAELPDLRLFNEGRHRGAKNPWNFPTAYLTGGFDSPQHDEHKRMFRWTTGKEAGLLVPLAIATEARTFSLWVLPNGDPSAVETRVEILVNGTVYYDEKLGDGWTLVEFTVPAKGLSRGENHFVIRSEPRAYSLAGFAPPPDSALAAQRDPRWLPSPSSRLAVGVAVRDLAISYPRPSSTRPPSPR